jgi:ribosome-binding protein aMBF1 (putative translation factor)
MLQLNTQIADRPSHENTGYAETMAAPDDVAATLADEFKTRRDAADLTQSELASAMGKRTNVYQRLEYNERSCSIRQLVAIANALEVPAWQILKAAEERAEAGDLPEHPGAGPRGAFGID